MAKRKQGDLPSGFFTDGDVSDPSADFGFSEVVKGFYHLHPIWKGLHTGGGGKDCYDKHALISQGEDGGFTGAEVMRNYYHLHPIWKDIKGSESKQFDSVSEALVGQGLEAFDDLAILKKHASLHLLWKVMNGGAKNDRYDELHAIFQFAKGKRSKGRVPRKPQAKQDAEVDEVKILNESKSQVPVRRGRSNGKSNAPGRLDSEKFEFYIESIWKKLSDERKKDVTYFDSLWYSLYSEGLIKRKVMGWIQKKKIFSKKYVFIPIVLWRHWFLLILCNFNTSSDSANKRCMLLLDSMRDANCNQLEPGIRRFVFDIFKSEERDESKADTNKIPLLIPKVPQHKNGEECGFFVVYYINQFLKGVDDGLEHSEFMKEDWFKPEEVQGFIKSLD